MSRIEIESVASDGLIHFSSPALIKMWCGYWEFTKIWCTFSILTLPDLRAQRVRFLHFDNGKLQVIFQMYESDFSEQLVSPPVLCPNRLYLFAWCLHIQSSCDGIQFLCGQFCWLPRITVTVVDYSARVQPVVTCIALSEACHLALRVCKRICWLCVSLIIDINMSIYSWIRVYWIKYLQNSFLDWVEWFCKARLVKLPVFPILVGQSLNIEG